MALTIFLTHSQEKKITITFSDDENPFETATVADLKDRAHRIFGWPGKVPSKGRMRLSNVGFQVGTQRNVYFPFSGTHSTHMWRQAAGGRRAAL